MLEADGLSTLHLEHRQDDSQHRRPTYRPALVTRWSVTRRNVVAALRSIRGARLAGFREFAGTVRRTHPAVTVRSPIWIARRARSVQSISTFFEDVLRRSAPRLACCSVFYTLVGMAFCLAARRLGIPSVDVQHGVTLGNPAYEGWSQFPVDGYSLLPKLFWCWSDADARPVNNWPSSARAHHQAVVGGHPWMALWQSDHPLVASAVGRLPPRADDGLTVLVTLTWSSGLSELLRQVIASSPSSWRWWVRLHPLMERERASISSWCAGAAAGRASVDAPTDLPLPLLLERADVHLTHNSSVVQEAARKGLPSVVIDSHALGVYDELRSGWAVFAADGQSALSALRSQHEAASSLPRVAPYPSWKEMRSAVRLLVESTACRDTAAAASSLTAARA
jgi:hypothetical protein